ncbi:MAG TPA: hypothetical protein VF148_13920 [Acidimicrobiia bacterium]
MSEFNQSREDEKLLAMLRKALADSDAVPSDVVAFAKAAFTWRDIDAELAELDFDSADEDLPAGVRSSTTLRMISFQAGQWMIDIEYDEAAGRLIGATSPPARYTVELHTSGASFMTESDDMGRFTADGIARGPLGMVLRFTRGQVVKTQWVVL